METLSYDDIDWEERAKYRPPLDIDSYLKIFEDNLMILSDLIVVDKWLEEVNIEFPDNDTVDDLTVGDNDRPIEKDKSKEVPIVDDGCASCETSNDEEKEKKKKEKEKKQEPQVFNMSMY